VGGDGGLEGDGDEGVRGEESERTNRPMVAREGGGGGGRRMNGEGWWGNSKLRGKGGGTQKGKSKKCDQSSSDHSPLTSHGTPSPPVDSLSSLPHALPLEQCETTISNGDSSYSIR